MKPKIHLLIALLSTAIILTSCREKHEEPPDPATITLTGSEIAHLLGVKQDTGLVIGKVISGRSGVRIESMTMRPTGTADGPDIDVEDIELTIESTGKMQYAISRLRIGKIDILDLKTSQRAQFFGINVDAPGERFLTKLQAAISSSKSGSTLKTADLTCARLAIKSIEYQIRDKAAKVTKVRVDEFSIANASNETIGLVSVGGILIAGGVGVKDLKSTNVDRTFADTLLESLLSPPRDAEGVNDGASPSRDQHSKTNLHSSAAAIKRIRYNQYHAVESGRVIPFDHLSVKEMPFGTGFEETEKLFNIRDLRLDVKRASSGRFESLHGEANVTFPKQLAKKIEGIGFLDIFSSALANSQQSTNVSCRIVLNLVSDPRRNVEDGDISISLPKIGSLAIASTTRGLPQVINGFFSREDGHQPDQVGISALSLSYRDDGLFASLLNDPSGEKSELEKKLTIALEVLIILFAESEGQRERLAAEVPNFLLAPGTIKVRFEAKEAIDFETFLKKSLDPGHNSKGSAPPMTRRFSFSRK